MSNSSLEVHDSARIADDELQLVMYAAKRALYPDHPDMRLLRRSMSWYDGVIAYHLRAVKSGIAGSNQSQNILETMEQELLRRKFGPPVRLEVEYDIKPELLERLISELEITHRDVIKYQGPLDLTGLNVIADLDRPELRFPAYRSQQPIGLVVTEDQEPEAFFSIRVLVPVLKSTEYKSLPI